MKGYTYSQYSPILRVFSVIQRGMEVYTTSELDFWKKWEKSDNLKTTKKYRVQDEGGPTKLNWYLSY